jgi:hypothetical protein
MLLCSHSCWANDCMRLVRRSIIANVVSQERFHSVAMLTSVDLATTRDVKLVLSPKFGTNQVLESRAMP